jgi:hypothetical protein
MYLEKAVTAFEDTMTGIDKEPDCEIQENQLTGCKKLLEDGKAAQKIY